MTKWVPKWLAEKYAVLVARFWLEPFTVEEAREALGSGAALGLARLAVNGWLERLGRGKYRAVHPLILLGELTGHGWRAKIKQREYLPMLDFLYVKLIEGYGRRLRSVLLFGSVARGEARAESDVDLLVIVDELPPRYSDRIREALAIIHGWDDVKLRLWDEHGIHPNVEFIIISSEEAKATHPFYIDACEEGVVMFDREGFVSAKLKEVKERLRELGAVKVEEPDGRWYWILTPHPDLAPRLEL